MRLPRRARARTGLLGTVFLTATLALLLPTTSVVSATSYGYGNDVSWTNGVVLCDFAASMPEVAVSQLSLGGTGLTVSLLSLSEVSPSDHVVASADLSGLSWTVANRSTDEAFDLAYLVHAPLVTGSGSPTVVGSTNVTLQFVLPAYEGSPQGPTDAVNVVLTVANWTWQATGDHLAVSFGAAPAFPSVEHLSATSTPGWLLSSSSNSSGAILERVGANSSATVTSGAASPSVVGANATLAISSPEWATVGVSFGAFSGTITSLTYTARIGVVLPATVAGVPLSELAAAGVAGVAVSLVVALATRRIRRRPSKLIYVTEEEKP